MDIKFIDHLGNRKSIVYYPTVSSEGNRAFIAPVEAWISGKCLNLPRVAISGELWLSPDNGYCHDDRSLTQGSFKVAWVEETIAKVVRYAEVVKEVKVETHVETTVAVEKEPVPEPISLIEKVRRFFR